MKEGWERMVHPVSLDIDQINEIVKPAFGGKRVNAAERIGTGLSNSNYKIRMEGSSIPFVLRLYREGTETADKELAVSRLVQQTVPTAEFIYADTSCTACDKPWAVLEWKEGILLRDLMKTGSREDIDSAASSIGSVLSQIHANTFPQSGFFNKDLKVAAPLRMNGERFLSFIEDSLFRNECGKWLGEELKQSVWSYSQSNSPLLSESRETPVLVHSDFNGLNILMKPGPGGYSVSAVLDWEFAFSWNRHVDIANMLRYEEEGSRFEQRFIQGYQEQGIVLEDNWRILSKLEDLVALCDMLSQSTIETSNRVQDLKRLIENTVTV